MWSQDRIIELIELLHSTPILWDTRCKEYKDKTLKYVELARIAAQFGINVRDVEKKFKTLRTQFRREHRKIQERSKKGEPAIPPEKLWFGYHLMTFLLEIGHSNEDDPLGTMNTEETNLTLLSVAENEKPQILHENQQSLPSTARNIFIPNNQITNTSKRKNINDTNAYNTQVEEMCKFMRVVYEKVMAKDHFSIYGENVANRLRYSSQNQRAVTIAKNRIDNILFQLEIGEFDNL